MSRSPRRSPRPGHLAARWGRLTGRDRVAGVDLARGLAIVGMFAAHLLTTSAAWEWTDPSTWDSIVDGRSSILFATLAGVSIGLVTGGSAPLSGRPLGVARGRLAVRAGMLWVIGILLILTGVPVYVILPAYAILFLIALPFLSWPPRRLLWAVAGTAVVMPFVQPLLGELPLWTEPLGPELSAALGWHYPFTVWIAFVLAGLLVARAGLTRLRVQVGMLLAGAVLAVVGYALLPRRTDSVFLTTALSADPHSSGLGEVVGSGGFAMAVLGACLLICRGRVAGMLVLPLRATGSMPLTAYTAQLLVWAGVMLVRTGDTSDLGGFRALAPFWPLTLGTVVGCTLWALLVGRGSLEWLTARVGRLAVRR